jgi:mannosyltransferase
VRSTQPRAGAEPHPQRSGRSRPALLSTAARRYAAVVAGIVAVALVVRLWQLGGQSFWIDEISVTSFVRSGRLLSDLRSRGGPAEPPFHFLLVWLALHLPIGFEAAARVPSAIAGSVEVLALVLLVREATRRRTTAVIAGSLMALAPFAVRYSQEARYYTTFSALHLLTWWLVLRALRLRTRGAWVAYGLTGAALLLTHPFAPLVLVIQAGVVAIALVRTPTPPERAVLVRGYALGAVLAIGIALPWFAWGALRWVPDARAGKSYALNPPGRIAVDTGPDLVTRSLEWLLGNAEGPTVLVVLLVLLGLAAPLLARGRDRVVALATLGYVVGVFVLLVPLARAMGTYFAFRRVELFVAPCLALAAIGIVAGVSRLRALGVASERARAAGVAVCGVLLLLSAVAVVRYYGTQKSSYRALAAAVRDAPADRAVVIGPVDERWRPLIPQYLRWQGVPERPITFIVAGEPVPAVELRPGGVLWLTGSPPRMPALDTEAFNDLDRMQVIAGDRSVTQAILPWFGSWSDPRSQAELDRQRDRVARLLPFMAAGERGE